VAEARVENYPDYDSYPVRTSRDIPVVILRGGYERDRCARTESNWAPTD
jgi:hypothetical protein